MKLKQCIGAIISVVMIGATLLSAKTVEAEETTSATGTVEVTHEGAEDVCDWTLTMPLKAVDINNLDKVTVNISGKLTPYRAIKIETDCRGYVSLRHDPNNISIPTELLPIQKSDNTQVDEYFYVNGTVMGDTYEAYGLYVHTVTPDEFNVALQVSVADKYPYETRFGKWTGQYKIYATTVDACPLTSDQSFGTTKPYAAIMTANTDMCVFPYSTHFDYTMDDVNRIAYGSGHLSCYYAYKTDNIMYLGKDDRTYSNHPKAADDLYRYVHTEGSKYQHITN